MSKPSLASKITDVFKRAFGRSTRPVVSSKPEDIAAGDAAVKDSAPNEAIPAEAASPDAAAEFATEAASAQEQQPAETPQSPEAAAAEPEDRSGLVAPEEEAEIAQTLDSAEADTVTASTGAFTEAREAAEPAGGAAELPVPNYDTLTLPSIRARLRRLTIEQVRELRAYESANANRPEFVRMYDNRIAKLEAEAAE